MIAEDDAKMVVLGLTVCFFDTAEELGIVAEAMEVVVNEVMDPIVDEDGVLRPAVSKAALWRPILISSDSSIVSTPLEKRFDSIKANCITFVTGSSFAM